MNPTTKLLHANNALLTYRNIFNVNGISKPLFTWIAHNWKTATYINNTTRPTQPLRDNITYFYEFLDAVATIQNIDGKPYQITYQEKVYDLFAKLCYDIRQKSLPAHVYNDIRDNHTLSTEAEFLVESIHVNTFIVGRSLDSLNGFTLQDFIDNIHNGVELLASPKSTPLLYVVK